MMNFTFKEIEKILKRASKSDAEFAAKTNRLTNLVNKLFNAKPNEQVVKSIVGEMQIPYKIAGENVK